MSFDHYFGKMEGLVKDKKVPARVRFLIQDVIDLRNSKWIPRREKAGPKTLDQIHKEVEKEKTQQQVKNGWVFLPNFWGEGLTFKFKIYSIMYLGKLFFSGGEKTCFLRFKNQNGQCIHFSRLTYIYSYKQHTYLT